MGQQIIQQPDGRLAVFSSITDTFIIMDATPEEIIEWRAQEAAEQARGRTKTELDKVLANPQTAYGRRALAWEEASRLNQEHEGDLHPADCTTEQ